MHDHADVGLIGLDVRERVDVQTFAASAVTSSVDIIHAPAPSSSTQLRRQRDACAAASAGSGARGAARRSTTSTAAGSRRGRAIARRPSAARRHRGEARPHVLAQLVGVVGQPQQVERGHRAGVQARVPDRQPVGDDRRARRPRLQAGHAAGRVHEHVGGREQLGHLVGEAVHVHARLVGEGLRAASARAARCARPGRRCSSPRGRAMNSRTAPSMSPTPQPPPETTTMRPSSGRPSARRACSGQRGCRNSAEISGRTEPHAAAPGDPLDRAHRLAVHHQVHVDPRLRPEEQAGQVGDRGDRRARRSRRVRRRRASTTVTAG